MTNQSVSKAETPLHGWRNSSNIWRWIGEKDLRAESIFLFLAVFFGLLYFLIIPPFLSPDEIGHFDRTWAVSDGILFRYIYPIPNCFISLQNLAITVIRHPENKLNVAQLSSFFHQPLLLNETTEIDFTPAGFYPPVIYFPQAIGVRFGRLFNSSPLLIYYFGRLANYLVWVLLAWVSVKIIPAYKWVYLLLLFMPMSFYQAISLSPDVLTNGAAFLATAVVLKLASNETSSIGWKETFWLYGAFALVALTKVPYFFLTAIIFLIPARKFGSRARYLSQVALFFIVIGVIVVLANLYSFSPFFHVNQVRNNVPPPNQRISEFMTNPVKVGKLIGNTIRLTYDKIFHSYVGILGWLDIPLPSSIYFLVPMMIALIMLVDGSPQLYINPIGRFLMATVSLGICLITMLLVYLSFTNKEVDFIVGFQGRYIIPVGPLIAFVPYNRLFVKWNKYGHWLATGFLVWLLFVVARVLFLHFYIV